MYIELGVDETRRLAALSFIAVSLNVLGPMYDGMALYISSLLPFDPGEVVLAGYGDVVERCGRLLRSDDPRFMNRHILLAGPPGCGKSMIAKRVAANHPEFVRCNLTRVDDWVYWISMLAKILDKCKRRVLLIIDEIDEIGMSRRSGRKSVYELLRLMDGVENSMNVTILATTNRLKDLDEALLRPGRFGPVMFVGAPDREQVRAILEYYGRRYSAGIDAERVLDEVELGFSGAEIRIAVEDCIVDGSDVTTDGVIENLRRLKMLREVIPVRKKYYTKEFPSGPWSRALYAMRTGKPFEEEEFRDDHKDS
jgi:SpoVK/Ycf46/Vps4 family AAA+-type ATPase